MQLIKYLYTLNNSKNTVDYKLKYMLIYQKKLVLFLNLCL